MIPLRQFFRRSEGATAVEFAFTAPLFIGLVFAVIESGLALWTQFGLEHGVEAAARCASINTTTCSNASTTAAYAASNAFGLSIPQSVFSVTTQTCGFQVNASYNYAYFTKYFGAPTVNLKAQACYPAYGLAQFH